MNKYDAAIAHSLSTNTCVHHDRFVILPETATTMADADEAIRQGKPNGYNVIALRMTNGIGSTDAKTGIARKWASLDGNLFLSRIVGIHRHNGEHERHIDWIASLAAGEVAARFTPNANLVWHCPNDLWATMENGDYAKWGGILVPQLPNKHDPGKVVLGIGINIKAAPEPDAARLGTYVKHFTSLNDLGAFDLTIGRFMEQFDIRFEQHLAAFRATKNFNDVLQKMGFIDKKNGRQITLTFRDARPQITGHFKEFATVINAFGVTVSHMRIDCAGTTKSFATGDLFLTSKIQKPSP